MLEIQAKFLFFFLHEIKMSKQPYFLSSKLSLTYRIIMLTILAKCSHSCLLCLCGNREYPVNFQNKLVSSSFTWVPKYILFLAKLKGQGRPFWNGEKHSLTLQTISYMGEGAMLTIIKVFIILFLLEWIGNILEIFKINQ